MRIITLNTLNKRVIRVMLSLELGIMFTKDFPLVVCLSRRLWQLFPRWCPRAGGARERCCYYEKPNNSKRWIVSQDDLDAMYRSYGKDDTINLWCEGRVEVEHSKKRDHSDDSSGEEISDQRREGY